MDNRTIVWAVTSGEYSDFRVEAVFETEADANAARARGMGDSVEEMDYYAACVKPARWKMAKLVALLDMKTGAMWEAFGRPAPQKPEDIHPFVSQEWRHPGRPRITKSVAKSFVAYDGVTRWRVEVEGPDNDRTRKVFYDLVAKTRAEIVEGHR